jgi:hypothetical protein
MLKTVWIFALCCFSLNAATMSSSRPVTFIDKRLDPGKPVLASNGQGDVAIAWAASQEDEPQSLQFSFKRREGEWAPVKMVSENNDIAKIKLTVSDEGTATLLWRESAADQKTYYFFGQKSEEGFWSAPFRVVDAPDKLKVKLKKDKVVFVGLFEDFGDAIKTEKGVPYHLIETAVPLQRYPDSYWGSSSHFNSQGDGLMVGYHKELRDDYFWRKDFFTCKAFWLSNHLWSGPQKVCELPQDEYVEKCKCLQNENDASSGALYLATRDKRWDCCHRVMLYDQGHWSVENDLVPRGFTQACKLAMNSQNDLLLVWKNKENQRLEATFKPQGQEWRRVTLASDITELSLWLSFGGDIQIKSDEAGNFVVIWTDFFTAFRHLHTEKRQGVYGVVFSIKDQTVSDPILLSPVPFDCSQPSLAITALGHGFVSWIASNKVDKAVQVAEFCYTP